MQEEKYSSVRTKIVGQIFDSLTMGGLEKMITGVAQKVHNPIGRAMVTMGTKSYLWATKTYTVDYYEDLVEFFKEAPLRTPVLLFYSLNDPLLCPDAMEDMIDKWRAMNDPRLEVFSKCWPISRHALHVRSHPSDYHLALKSFLLRLGLETPTSRL
ncbi:hypothetical protein CAPTEDRAFT_206755 [Capitella teleta]|uniref:Uncharacterized protein n=1 Tax=Capitella teleta TaxID=283909 RepID=R7TSL2_CAPTE|nr:hypothetical protein CAPTEDRAFT_206755 [Capitella teleta]|eukprot:ELT94476.1 hypothetical protein CAPTEDRAFT_206755 [Capitella teleta]